MSRFRVQPLPAHTSALQPVQFMAPDSLINRSDLSALSLSGMLHDIRDPFDRVDALFGNAGPFTGRSDGLVAAPAAPPDEPVSNGSGDTTVAVAASGNQGIDGLLAGSRWADGFITYSFPDAAADYGAGYPEALTNFQQINAAQQLAAHFALNTTAYTQPAAALGFSIEGFTNLGITFTTTDNAGTLRFANTSDPGTAYAYYPNNGTTGGDSFYGNSGRSPVMGNYHWHTMLHETGHALGLKHGQETIGFGAMPSYLDAMEYSVMTYRSYVGGPTTGYTNETYGYAQTYMMYDIAALQYMYGADFTENAGNTTYKWDPSTGNTLVDGAAAITPGGNRIFMTVWDGGGTDTYDLSAYVTGVTVNLSPGGFSLLSSTQQAYLGGGNYAKGNVYNALLYGGDLRSLIENATGGSGGDTLYGNQADNVMSGNAGNDYIWTSSGDDVLSGGEGDDTLYGAEGNDYNLGGAGNDYIWAYTGADTLVGGEGIDSLYGGDGDDYLSGSQGTDIDAVMDGGNGNDTLSMSFLTVGHVFDFELGQARTIGGVTLGTLVSIETFYGGSGGDVIISDGNGHLYYGLSGNDTMVAELGSETLDGGAGFDVLDTTRWTGDYVLNLSTGSSNYLGELYTNFEGAILGAGHDSVTGTAVANMLNGGAGNDTISSGDGDDTIYGADGNDSVFGGNGRDLVALNAGNDVFRDSAQTGAAGMDTVYGGFGNDTLVAAGGDDALYGGGGNDSLTGGEGNDSLTGDAGNDTLIGWMGNDVYVTDGSDLIWEGVGHGNDVVFSSATYALTNNIERLMLTGTASINGFGNALNNILNGNAGANWMHGGLGNDTMTAGAGNDTLRGAAGTDRLDGGLGNDVLWGDAGADTLIFRAGADRIMDFANNIDTIALDDALWGGAPRTIAQILALATEVAGDVLFSFGGGNTLRVENVATRGLLADDILVI